MTINNKYYVAADSVTSAQEQTEPQVSFGPGRRWTHRTLEEALEHAAQILEENPRKEHVAVSKVVRIVRRVKAPMSIEVID